ncbi:MAG: nucleotidyl transferase AbiEii/AbiGii toxin family protein [Dehalococcoidia bacterium]|nr:nucleotidyl transferase AbiEii/AbiGii toxin family protein [Dehalococcoidia bacterium]
MPAEEPPLRTLRVRIAEAARNAGKPQFVIEKDYAISYLLMGIVHVPELRESLVFKGGTCLRKAYFAGYRFSEDLDYTSRRKWDADGLLNALREAGGHMKDRLLDYGPFEVEVAPQLHRDPHPRGQLVFRVRVQFPWMGSPTCSLKIEIAVEEPLLNKPEQRRLIHEYTGEALDVSLLAYSLEEIAAEKLRAFLQARQHLRDRGWLRNRPRDLFDLWYLHQQRDRMIDWHYVGRLLPEKAGAYGLSYIGLDDFLDGEVLDGIRKDWRGQLPSFVPQMPSFDECIGGLRTILQRIFEQPDRHQGIDRRIDADSGD